VRMSQNYHLAKIKLIVSPVQGTMMDPSMILSSVKLVAMVSAYPNLIGTAQLNGESRDVKIRELLIWAWGHVCRLFLCYYHNKLTFNFA
jgi:hypothetical protein